jgi:hypothetical protein
LPYSLKEGDIIDLGRGVSLIFKTPLGLWEAVENISLEESSCG